MLLLYATRQSEFKNSHCRVGASVVKTKSLSQTWSQNDAALWIKIVKVQENLIVSCAKKKLEPW